MDARTHMDNVKTVYPPQTKFAGSIKKFTIWYFITETYEIKIYCIQFVYQKVSKHDQEYHNHTLQTNPRHLEEEPQNIYSNNTSVRQ